MSSRHSNEPGSFDENVNRGVSSVVEPTGPESSDVSGATVSTVNRRDAGVASVPPALVARTEKVYEPFVVVVYVRGDVQGA